MLWDKERGPVAEYMRESIVRVRCRLKESSRSLSLLLMFFLYIFRPNVQEVHVRYLFSWCSSCTLGRKMFSLLQTCKEPSRIAQKVVASISKSSRTPKPNFWTPSTANSSPSVGAFSRNLATLPLLNALSCEGAYFSDKMTITSRHKRLRNLCIQFSEYRLFHSVLFCFTLTSS